MFYQPKVVNYIRAAAQQLCDLAQLVFNTSRPSQLKMQLTFWIWASLTTYIGQ